jgi:hypothetical protein
VLLLVRLGADVNLISPGGAGASPWFLLRGVPTNRYKSADLIDVCKEIFVRMFDAGLDPDSTYTVKAGPTAGRVFAFCPTVKNELNYPDADVRGFKQWLFNELRARSATGC